MNVTPLCAELDDRIAAAFGDGAKSEDLVALIAETEAALIASGEAAERARTRALDPVLAAIDVAEARRRMEDEAFRHDRLKIAVTRLREHLEQVKAQEENQRRRIAYETAKTERDKLAEELASMYPPIAEQLADLLTRIEASDREIERINARALPSGTKPLAIVELAARGLKGFRQDGLHNVPRITEQLRLPAFTFDKLVPFTWPERR